jgi:glycosyltransferase involved in cell wall biosynthesis
VCIPSYESETFIERTLRCAREQTYEAQRIVVSIDRSEDGTEEICRAHAHEDDRIEIYSHDVRLGWVGNVNFLLDAARSEFAFIFFHDDLIEPTYTERLVEALRRRPDSASAHCDVVLDDGVNEATLRRGCAYDGSPAERLLTYFIQREPGALLRSMVRTAGPAGGLRMSPAAVVYEMALVAAGPAVRVAEPLYRRWTKRPGGLTVRLARRPLNEALQAYRHNAVMAQIVIDELHPSPADRELLDFGLAVYMTNHLRTLDATYGTSSRIELQEVLDSPPSLRLPRPVDELPVPLAELCEAALDRIDRRTAAQDRRIAEIEAPG